MCAPTEQIRLLHFEYVLKLIFQNARAICTNMPFRISKIEDMAIDSLVVFPIVFRLEYFQKYFYASRVQNGK